MVVQRRARVLGAVVGPERIDGRVDGDGAPTVQDEQGEQPALEGTVRGEVAAGSVADAQGPEHLDPQAVPPVTHGLIIAHPPVPGSPEEHARQSNGCKTAQRSELAARHRSILAALRPRVRRIGAVRASDAEDRNARPQCVGDGPEVVLVGGEDTAALTMSDGDHVDVHDVGGVCSAGESADIVGDIVSEGDDVASSQEPAELRLASRPAHLRHDGSGRGRHETELEPGPVIRPDLAVGSFRSDERSRVVDDAHAERFLGRDGLEPSWAATRVRAAASSASEKGPCSASHSAIAASPSRTWSARRAALVIQADTLTPSEAAASITRSWTSASTVIANFGDGFPRGIEKLYYRSRSARPR